MNHPVTANPAASEEFSEAALLQSATEFQTGKQYGVARQLYLQILARNPRQEVAWHSLGLVEYVTGRHAQAADYIGKAVDLKPDYAHAHANLAAVLRDMGRLEAAREAAKRAIRLDPGFAPAHNNLGSVLEDLGETQAALAAYMEAGRLDPFFIEARSNAAQIFCKLGRHDEGLKLCAAIAEKRPDAAAPHFAAGNILRELLRPEEARIEFQQAIALDPDFAEAYCNLGNLLQRGSDFAGAVVNYEKALTIKPELADVHCNLGMAYESLLRTDDALKSYDRAVALDPARVGVRLQRLHLRRVMCDWTGDEAEERAALAVAAANSGCVPPFGPLAMNSGHALQLDLARRWARAFRARPSFDHRGRPRDPNRKLRIGYLSGDFFRHATAILMAGLFEHHDRARFEIIAYSHGRNDGSELRHRLLKAFDNFVDISEMDDRAAAARIYADEVDILIDLKGYTQFSRSEIVAHRPAPIQVNFIGYPGTMGADFIDYVIADPIVLPLDQQPYYDEKIVHLPDSYQPNDRQRPIDARTPTRAESGLPEEGFVFCSFNNSYKITPKFFGIWMKLLAAVPGSVLWLLDANDGVKANLRKEAEARGITGDRLAFAPRTALGTHLARHRLADLFLDTLPYNAHTTTSDALWAGLPVLTLQGDTFAGRVASSLLHAVGLPELVTHSIEDYEALALKLVRTPELLADLRRRLSANRMKTPAFDTARYARHLEVAYSQMWDTWADGKPAHPISVTSLGKPKPEPLVETPQIARQAYATCPLCGSGAHKALLGADCSKDAAYHSELAPRVEWHVCEDCDHVFAGGYFAAGTFASPAFAHDMEAGRRAVAPLVANVARHIGTRNCDGAWLDVGFGDGALLLTAAEFGFEAVGLESSATHVDVLRQLGFEGHVGAIEGFEASGRFAVVSFDDQLPRLADPAAALAAAHWLLQPDGLLVLSLPNMDAMAFNLLHAQGANPYWTEIARIHMFGRERLYGFLREQGFQPLEYQVNTRLRAGMDVIARRVG